MAEPVACGDMLRFLAVLVFLAGAVLAAGPWIPNSWLPTDRLPGWWPPDARIGYALLGVAVVLWLLGARRRRTSGAADDRIRDELERRGFRFELMGDDGWQARGAWNGQTLIVRKGSGAQANRFGRAWIVLLRVAGRPVEPWPLSPNKAQLIRDDGRAFEVVLPETGLAGGGQHFAERVDQVLAARE